jgi:hypothetical protein
MVEAENNKLIKQPYAITMAKHQLNIHEFRIMTRIIEALQPNMSYGRDRTEVQKTLLGDLILQLPTQVLLPDKSDNYSCVKRSLKTLERKVINIQGKDSRGEYETSARLIMKSKYYLNNQMVEIQLDRDLLPDMLALAKNYSQYLVEVTFNASSPYVAKLYLYVSHWRDKTKKTVMIDTLRDWLVLEDKYEKPKDLRRRILEPAAKELKQYADVWFEIEAPMKKGRAIVGYIFKIYKREHNIHLNKAHAQHIKNTLRELFGLGDFQLNKLDKIINKPELYDHIHTKIQEIDHQVRQGKVKYVKSYVLKSLQNEFQETEEETIDPIREEELAEIRKELRFKLNR